MLSRLMITLVTLLCIANPSAAFYLPGEDFVTFSDHYAYCMGVRDGTISADDSDVEWAEAVAGTGMFGGFVMGVVVAYDDLMFKIPAGAEAEEVVAAVRDFIEFNLEYCQESSARDVVMMAVRVHWPELNGLEPDSPALDPEPGR